MATLTIPVSTDTDSQRLEVDLSGVTYLLRLRWNDRAGCYMLDLMTPDETPLLVGRAVRTNQDLLEGSRVGRSVPPGRIIPIDVSGRNEEPARGELGGKVLLVYQEPAA